MIWPVGGFLGILVRSSFSPRYNRPMARPASRSPSRANAFAAVLAAAALVLAFALALLAACAAPSPTALPTAVATATPTAPPIATPSLSPSPSPTPTPVYYAEIPAMTVASALPGADATPRYTHLVDVRKAAPGIAVDLLYARAGNVFGTVLYGRDLCLLQESTLAKLQAAQAEFLADGYCLKVFDGYRPYSVTVQMAGILHVAPKYLADPKTGSRHNTGCAVDLTVTDLQGRELAMSCPVDTLDERASRTYAGMTENVRRNLAYVEGVMRRAGFAVNPAEWWHYNDTASAQFPILDYRLEDAPLVPSFEAPAATPPPVRDPAESGTVDVGAE